MTAQAARRQPGPPFPCAHAGVSGADWCGPPGPRDLAPWELGVHEIVAYGDGLACARGQSSLMVAYFPSRCCGDNHTVLGSYLCAYVRQLMQTSVYVKVLD